MLFEKTSTLPAGRLFLLVLSVCCSFIPGLTQTQIGGVVNQYSRIIGAGNCPSVIEVTDPTGFTVGQKVLIMAMQGGQMSTSNNADFGAPTPGPAVPGIYDWTSITEIDGNQISLAHALSPGYDFSAVVQLIGIASYDEAVVVSELLPKAWDGRTGGVLALEVTGALELQADVNVSGRGFRGGLSVQAADDNCNLLTNANAYFYEAGNWRGAPKGEGIVPFAAGREYGRGPQVNGGGGANTHNAGGGGGGNRVSGGLGGENREPSFGGCDGFYPGLGGRAIPGTEDQWIMGGGGGAGHRNNNSISSGGNGGGIIVIKAARLIFTGGAILADGLDGGSGVGDGGGGGGAGGTIVLDLQQVEGTPLVSAVGGRGGDVSNPGNRCMGPGGGGSGGQVYSTIPLDATLNGGAAGLTINSTSCSPGNNGAQAGTIGNFSLRGIKSSLPVELPPVAGFTAETDGLSVLVTNNSLRANAYQWLITELPDYQSTEVAPLIVLPDYGAYELQLLAINSCGVDTLSAIISVGNAPQAAFSLMRSGNKCAPAVVDWVDRSDGVYDTYFWEFPGGEPATSTSANPTVTYSSAGTFDVRLTVSGPLGSSTIDSISAITIVDFPQPEFSYQVDGLTVAFSTSTDPDLTYVWSFGDGNSSREKDPIHTFAEPGIYDVTLNVQNEGCARAVTRTVLLTPTATTHLPSLSGILPSPNPSRGRFRMMAERDEWYPLELHIFDSGGRLIHRQRVGKGDWVDLSPFPAGLYWIDAVSPLGRGAWRVLKQE